MIGNSIGLFIIRSTVSVAISTVLATSAPALEAYSPEESELMVAKKAFNEGYYQLSQARLENYLKAYPQTDKAYEAHLILGRTYFKQGEMSKALDEFDMILNGPTGVLFRDEALYWAGEVYLRNGEYRKALEMFQQVIDEFPNTKYISYSVYSKAWAYYKLGLIEDAILYFRNVAAKYPYEKLAQDATFRSGECEFLLGNFDKASSEYDLFLDKYPVSDKTADAYYMSGESRYRIGLHPESVASLERALSISSGAAWANLAVYRMGRSYLDSGAYDKSIAAFRRSMDGSVSEILRPAAMAGQVIGYEKMGETSEALKICDDIGAKYPASDMAPWAYYTKARIYFDSAKYAQSEAVCRDALMRYPASAYEPYIRYELGWSLILQNRPDDAIAEFKEAAGSAIEAGLSASALCKLGDIYVDSLDLEKAAGYYDTALDKYSDAPCADYAQYQTGMVSLYMKRYDRAILAFQSVLVNFPDTPLRQKTIFQLGIAFLRKGNFDKAESEFLAYIKDYPSAADILKARLSLANSLYGLGRYEEALGWYSKIAAAGSGDESGEAAYQIGWCYSRMHRTDDAVYAFGSFIRGYPSSILVPYAKLWFGGHYRSIGDYPKAREYFVSVANDRSSGAMMEEALYQLALTSIDEGRLDDAASHLGELAAKFPASNLARTGYRMLAKTKKAGGMSGDAIELLKKSLSADNNESNAQTQYEIAESYEEMQEIEKAASEYIAVRERYDKGLFWSVRAQLKAAQLYEHLARYDDARKLYKDLAAMDVQESELAKKRLKELYGRRGN